jgi:hypothetical protein
MEATYSFEMLLPPTRLSDVTTKKTVIEKLQTLARISKNAI